MIRFALLATYVAPTVIGWTLFPGAMIIAHVFILLPLIALAVIIHPDPFKRGLASGLLTMARGLTRNALELNPELKPKRKPRRRQARMIS